MRELRDDLWAHEHGTGTGPTRLLRRSTQP